MHSLPEKDDLNNCITADGTEVQIECHDQVAPETEGCDDIVGRSRSSPMEVDEDRESVFRVNTSNHSSRSYHHPRSPPMRSATFPFKPASALQALQSSCSNTSDSSVTSPSRSPFIQTQTGSFPRDEDCTIRHSDDFTSHRSMSFPIYSQINTTPQQLQLSLADYVSQWAALNSRGSFGSPATSSSQVIPIKNVQSEDGSLHEHQPDSFPVEIDSPCDTDCWWLSESSQLAEELEMKKKCEAIIHFGDDEIELVDSTSVSFESEEMKWPSSLGQSESEDDKEVNPLYSPDDVEILREIRNKLKEDMQRADLDDDNKEELEHLLQRLNEATSLADLDAPATAHTTNVTSNAAESSNNDGTDEDMKNSKSSNSIHDSIRKPLVAIAGGTLVTTGIVLIPMPIIPGCLVVYAGLAVLASEFEGAKGALDTVKTPLEKWLADDEEEDSIDGNSTEEKGRRPAWTDMLPSCTSPDSQFSTNDEIDKDFMDLMRPKNVQMNDGKSESEWSVASFTRQTSNEFLKKEKEAARQSRQRANEKKRWLRKILKLDSTSSSTMDNDVSSSTTNTTTDEVVDRPSMLLRFDSVLSSYGEEIDVNGGVPSDRNNNEAEHARGELVLDVIELPSSAKRHADFKKYRSMSSGSISLNMNDASVKCIGLFREESVGTDSSPFFGEGCLPEDEVIEF